MDLGLKSKIAVVWGSSSGLGYALAKQLIEEGAKVILVSRGGSKLQEAKTHLGALDAMECDFTQSGAATALTKKIIEKYGRLDILVTNTGGPPKGAIENLSLADWNLGFQSLVLSVLEAVQCALPSMKQNGFGRILLVTSAAAKEAMPLLNVSNTLRSGLLGLCKSLSNEVAEFGITANCILPGFTDTERLQELKIPKEKIAIQIPAKRVGLPEEFAAVATFILSERASYLTGQAIVVDGGWMKSI